MKNENLFVRVVQCNQRGSESSFQDDITDAFHKCLYNTGYESRCLNDRVLVQDDDKHFLYDGDDWLAALRVIADYDQRWSEVRVLEPKEYFGDLWDEMAIEDQEDYNKKYSTGGVE